MQLKIYPVRIVQLRKSPICNIAILDVHSLQLNVNPVQYGQEECTAVECWMYRKCSVVKCTVGYTALKCNVVTFGLQCPKVQCGVK